jgi:hypothetical protein
VSFNWLPGGLWRLSEITFQGYAGVVFFRVVSFDEEGDLRKEIIVLAIGGLALLAGCNMGDKTATAPVTPKWKGARYHISFDKPPAKPNPAGVTIPTVLFTANPKDEFETRATLVIRFDTSGVEKDRPVANKMIMAPVDIHGGEGALPADYMDIANRDLSKFMGAYCMNGKVKLNVAMARSSLSNQANDAEVDVKRLSDWLPIEVDFKNPHPNCKPPKQG